MPIQSPAWNDFLSCPVCCLQFDGNARPPISLGCGHTLCAACLNKLHTNHCPFDQTEMNVKFSELPINRAILSLMSENGRRGDHRGGGPTPASTLSCGSLSSPPLSTQVPPSVPPAHASHYLSASETICKIALFLRPCAGMSNLNLSSGGSGGSLSRSMQRKLVTLINCQLLESEGRARAIRAARSLGERTVTELILHHQNHHQLSATLWAAVRSRGCQFLGPAMQEEVIQLVLLALEDGSALSRKVLVMFVVQRLEPHFPQASKTSIGHVVQLLYRASCFKVSKRERDSSLMQLKEEFRCYESLRREHDTQIVQIATEAGLRIAPDQWSSLLYGDVAHKSHMQSIMDKLQTPDSFAQSVNELLFVLHRTGDPGQLTELWPQLEILAKLDPGGGTTNGSAPSPADEGNSAPCDAAAKDTAETPSTDSNSNSDEESGGGWQTCAEALNSIHSVLSGLVHFLQHFGHRRLQDHHYHAVSKYRPAGGGSGGGGGRHPPIRHGGPPAPNAPLNRFDDDARVRNRYANNAAVNNNHHPNHAKVQQHENVSVSAPPNSAGQHQEKASPLTDNNSSSHYQHPSVKTSPNYNVMNSVPKVTNVDCRSVPPPPLQHSNSSAGNNGLHANNKEQSMNSGMNQTAVKMFDAAKVIGMNTQTRQPPYMSFPSTPPNLVRVPAAPPQSPFLHAGGAPTIYANTGMSPEFGPAYSPFPQQAAIFGNPANVAPTPVYPQAATPILTAEIYPPNAGTPQTVLVNPMPPMNHHVNAVPPQGHVYNVISPSTVEFICHKNPNPLQQSQQLLHPLPQHMPAGMPQQLMPQGAVLGSWYEFTSPQGLPAEMMPPVSTSSTHTSWTDLVDDVNDTITTTVAPSIEPTLLKKKSLSELQEMKDNIVTRLQTIVGKKETEEVEEHIANNQEHIPCVIPQTLSSTSSITPAFTSTYSIWTSGANFYSIARSCIEKEKSGIIATVTADSEISPNDCNMFSDESTSPCNSSNTVMPGISQFGPISKRQMSRPAASARPIQVSASNNVSSTTTTSTIGTNYPLLSLSPMPHQAVLFPSPGSSIGFPAFGVGMYHHPPPGPCLEPAGLPTATLNTIHHGIIDPPHLHMSQLDPSGCRPSDPLDKNLRHSNVTGSKEERQRQQLNAVTECIDPFNSVKDIPEERRLKQELSFVMHGIQEKLNVRQQPDDDTDSCEQLQSENQERQQQELELTQHEQSENQQLEHERLQQQQQQTQQRQQQESWLPHSSSNFELQQTW